MSSTTGQEPTPNPPIDVREVLKKAAAGQIEPGRIADLSDPDREQIEDFTSGWGEIPVSARREIIREMLRQSAANVALSFTRYYYVALRDEDSEIRALAVHGLWEDDSLSFLQELSVMSENESDAAVQEAVAAALGRFSYKIEMDELGPEFAALAQKALFQLMSNGKNWMVRRRALESAAYMSQNQRIKDAIAEAAESDFEQERAGALVAMGRNLDQRWFPIVMKELTNEDPDIRCEAARAAGQFGDPALIDPLVRLTEDDDEEIRQVVVEAIGQIGGKKAIDTLVYLETQVSEDLQDTIKEALEEARFLAEPTGLED